MKAVAWGAESRILLGCETEIVCALLYDVDQWSVQVNTEVLGMLLQSLCLLLNCVGIVWHWLFLFLVKAISHCWRPTGVGHTGLPHDDA